MNFVPYHTDQYQDAILRSGVPEIDSYSILIHNGHYIRNQPAYQFPEGLAVDNFANGEGFSLLVAANTKSSKPIRIINLFDGHCDTLIQPRNRVIMEAGSSAELLVSDCTLSGEPFTCNDVTEITLGKAATLDLVRLQKLNSATRLITSTSVQQTACSRMKTHYVTLCGGSICNHLSVKLSEEKAKHVTAGLSVTQQNERADHDILIEHASPDCQSNQLFKQILSDSSTGSFTGRIVVNKDSRKTVAYQRSSNILLHPETKMNICPQLEIYADDVKCSHGATTGQLDTEALFYLRSRGISESEARQMLLQAFAGEVLDGISCAPFREGILRLMEDRKG